MGGSGVPECTLGRQPRTALSLKKCYISRARDHWQARCQLIEPIMRFARGFP